MSFIAKKYLVRALVLCAGIGNGVTNPYTQLFNNINNKDKLFDICQRELDNSNEQYETNSKNQNIDIRMKEFDEKYKRCNQIHEAYFAQYKKLLDEEVNNIIDKYKLNDTTLNSTTSSNTNNNISSSSNNNNGYYNNNGLASNQNYPLPLYNPPFNNWINNNMINNQHINQYSNNISSSSNNNNGYYNNNGLVNNQNYSYYPYYY